MDKLLYRTCHRYSSIFSRLLNLVSLSLAKEALESTRVYTRVYTAVDLDLYTTVLRRTKFSSSSTSTKLALVLLLNLDL